MRRILLVVNGRHAVEQFSALASEWTAARQAESVFWLADESDAVFLKELQPAFTVAGPGADAYAAGRSVDATAPVASATAPRVPPRERNAIVRALRPFAQVLRTAYAARKARSSHRGHLRALAVQAVVTTQERPFGFLPLVAAATDLHLPVVLIPANFICEADGGAFMRRADATLRPDLTFGEARRAGVSLVWAMNRFIAWLNPRQVFRSKFGAMLCYPGDYLSGLWLGGLLTNNMWHQGTRFVDRIVISGDEEADVCARAGLPPRRVAKLGNPVFDALADSVPERRRIRRDLAERLGADTRKKIIVLSVPSLWEHKMISREDQDRMLDDVLSVLRGHDGTVALSLHPKANARDYRETAARFGMPILDRPLMQVLVGIDAFVASAYSSTLRWAIALGLPAVNIDFWNLNESTYAAYPSYPVARDAEDLRRWLAGVDDAPWPDPDCLNIPAENFLGISMEQGFAARVARLVDQLIADPVAR